MHKQANKGRNVLGSEAMSDVLTQSAMNDADYGVDLHSIGGANVHDLMKSGNA